MILNFTSITYILGTVVFFFFVWRIAKTYQEQKTNFSKFFLYGSISFFFFYLLISIVSLFFATPLVLRIIIIVSIFLQSLACAFLAKAFYPITFPKFSQKLIQGIIFSLTLTVIILYYLSGEYPLIEPQGFINWNVPNLVGAIRMLIMAIFIIPALIIFFRYLKSESKEIRKKSILFLILFWCALFIAIPTMAIFETSGVSESVGSLFFIFVLGSIVFFIKEPERSKYVTKIE